MRLMFLLAAAAAIVSTIAPATTSAGAAPAACCASGTHGSSGVRTAGTRQINCAISTKLNCRTAAFLFRLA